ncbi:hypothetical protein [Nostoc sp.]|uniref:hypothetical protein n=1 Tax=Nostoc sp. TaxID=1180 RepID=UPI003FA56F82
MRVGILQKIEQTVDERAIAPIHLTQIQLQYDDKDAKTVVQVIMVIEQPFEEDETTYLLKSETNKKHLLKALENVEKGKLIFVNLDEYEKIVFETQTSKIEED